MQAWMWRLTENHAVLYTNDRSTLQAVLDYSRFPYRDLSQATTYVRQNGRAYAWQFTFPLSLWNAVVRRLGRSAITMLDEEGRPPRRAVPPVEAAGPEQAAVQAASPARKGAKSRTERSPTTAPVVAGEGDRKAAATPDPPSAAGKASRAGRKKATTGAKPAVEPGNAPSPSPSTPPAKTGAKAAPASKGTPAPASTRKSGVSSALPARPEMPAASVTRKTTRKPAAEPVAKPPAEAGKGSAAGTAREPAAATPRKKSPAVAVVAALLVEKAAGSRKGSKTVGSETETVSAALPKLPRTRRAAAKQASAAPSLPLEGLAAPVRPGRTKKQAAAAPEPAPPKSRGK